ncbi:hypothetical protein [Geodermatophilus chilensis]|nr:hypothetical protein [Geodermatophilus chilensis]
MHFTRTEVTRIALEPDADGQFDHTPMVTAAELLRTAEADVVA